MGPAMPLIQLSKSSAVPALHGEGVQRRRCIRGARARIQQGFQGYAASFAGSGSSCNEPSTRLG